MVWIDLVKAKQPTFDTNARIVIDGNLDSCEPTDSKLLLDFECNV
jgi:hypothetical protein